MYFSATWSCVNADAFPLPRSLVVSAPSVLRVGTPFTMTAHAEGATEDVRVTLSIMDSGNLLEEVQMVLSKKNNYADIINVKILPKGMDARRKTFVELVVECTGGGCKMKKSVALLVSFDGGHLFVQTNKPVYNPTEKVRFRVFPLDLNLVPSNNEVTIDIISPDGVLVQRKQSVARNIIISGNSFNIPPIAKSGNWRIVAHYTSFPGVNATAGFEVKEHGTFTLLLLSLFARSLCGS
uniref:complement C3-like n=1 Tax=Myxine glutinosa TaxID=7769 RepID=UPI00358FA5F3